MKPVYLNEDYIDRLLEKVKSRDQELFLVIQEILRTTKELVNRSRYNFAPLIDLEPTITPTLIPQMGVPIEFDTRNKKGQYWSNFERSGDWRHFVLDPSFVNAWHSVGVTLTNNTLTTLNFDSEDSDTDGIHNVSSNTDRFTINTPGVYIFIAHVYWDGNSNGHRHLDLSGNNGGFVLNTDTRVPTAVNMHQTVMGMRDLKRGDFVQVRALQTSGGNLNTLFAGAGDRSEVWGIRVR